MADKSGDARTMLLQALMSKVADDTYPSTTMLNTIEELLQEEDELNDYVALLVSRVADEQYPSIPIINRIRDLIS
jgi:hypothetical protein